MGRIVYHLMIPTIMPAVFFAIAFMPVQVMGCRTRGLIALLIAFISGLGALGAAITAIQKRLRGNSNDIWWVTSSLILVIPVIAIIVLA